MCDVDLCTRDWTLGAAGYCNDTICICPDGFDGIDDWETYNDCHVKASTRDIIHATVAVFALVQVVSSLVAMINVFRAKGTSAVFGPVSRSCFQCFECMERSASCCKASPTVDEDLTVRVDIDAMSTSEYDITMTNTIQLDEEDSLPQNSDQITRKRSLFRPRTPSRLSQHAAKIEEASFRAIMLLSLFFVFGVSTFVYEGMFLLPNPVYRFDNNPYQNLAFAFAASAMLNGLWLVGFILLRSLPNMRHYGNLFGVSKNSVFVKYPHLVDYWHYLMVCFTTIAIFLFAFILPLAVPEMIVTWNTFILLSMSADVVCWLVTVTVLSYLLSSVYKSAVLALKFKKIQDGDESSDDGDIDQIIVNERKKSMAVKSEKAFNRAHRTIKVTFGISVGGGTVGLWLLCGILWIPAMARNVYVCFTALALAAHLGAIGLTYLIVYRAMLS